MKTYFFECGEQDTKAINELLAAGGFKGEAVFVEGRLTPDSASGYSDAESVSVFVNSQVTAKVIEAMPNLKYISTRSTGFDHIDLAAAKAKNIAVSNVPAYGSRTVAEFAFSLILGLSRKSFFAFRQVRDEASFNIQHFEGFNLQGKTLGIVGTGRIGQNVAQIAKGFEMNILGFDAYPNTEAAAKLGFRYAALEDLLSQSDVISIHVPYNKDTHHLINKNNIQKIKPGAIFVNTARGEVVETDALIWALENKILSGVGIDVIEGEKMLLDESHVLDQANQDQLKLLLKDHQLINRPEVIYTPHIAFFTAEAKHEILKTSMENVLAAELGQPVNLVK